MYRVDFTDFQNKECRCRSEILSLFRYVECRCRCHQISIFPNVECRCSTRTWISCVVCSCRSGSIIIYILHLHSTFFFRAPSFGRYTTAALRAWLTAQSQRKCRSNFFFVVSFRKLSVELFRCCRKKSLKQSSRSIIRSIDCFAKLILGWCLESKK